MPDDFYRLVVESAREGIWAMDASRVTTYVNTRLADMLGRSREEMIGRHVTGFMFPEDLPDHQARMMVRVQGLGGKYEQRFMHANGSAVWCLVSATALMDAGGHFAGSFALLTDITSQRRIENALRESESNLRAFLDAIPSPAMILNAEGNIVLGNAHCARLLGIPAECLAGRDAVAAISPGELVPIHRDMLARLMEQPHPQAFEHRLGGQVLQNHVLPIIDPDQGCHRVAIIQMDVTEARQVEERLRRNETRLDTLVRLSQMSGRPIQEIMDFGLEEAIRLTNSRVGYIYFYNEAKRQFTLYSWSNSVMASCAIVEKQTVYDLDKTGIWGEAVRQRKTILVNEFQAPHPHKKGYPEGHVELYRYLTLPILEGNEIVAVVGVGNKESDYIQDDVEQLQMFMDGLWNLTQRKRFEDKLVYQSTHDSLTGIFNRVYFETVIERFKQDRRAYPVSMIMVDVNGLKATNDLQGHAAGDRLLKDTALVLTDVFRQEDTIARIGGDEFAALLPRTSESTAAGVLERLKRAIRSHNRRTSGFPLSLSCGLATGEDGCDLNELLRLADDRMYQDKFLHKISLLAPEPGIIESV